MQSPLAATQLSAWPQYVVSTCSDVYGAKQARSQKLTREQYAEEREKQKHFQTNVH